MNRDISLEIPKKLGGFEIIGTIGKGGMGDVYKARQISLNRLVALKILPVEFSRNEEFAQRFESEANVVSKLEHQNIVTTYDYGADGAIRYLAMTFVEGENLGDLLGRRGHLEPDEVVDLAKQVGRALKYAHSKRVLHRDIKPQNILVARGGQVLVTDFGIAKMLEQSKITNTGVVVGTPEYMSPEQAEGLELDQRTDIYSLGIVMYETLCGSPPFEADTPLSVAYKHVNVQPEPLREKKPEIPISLERIVLKALAKDREMRYKSADELLADLDNAFTDAHRQETRDINAVRLNIPVKTEFDEKRLEARRSSDRRGLGKRRMGDRRGRAVLFRIFGYTALAAVIIAAIAGVVYFVSKLLHG